MRVAIKDITSQNLDIIPGYCSRCLYWESPKEFERLKDTNKADESAHLAAKKKEWFLQTLKKFGTCGKIAYSNNAPIGYAQYSYASFLPQTSDYASKRVGTAEEGVVFLSCLYITEKKMRNKGIGKKLLESIIKDLKKRGFKAIETFARRNSSANPSGPMELYLKKGFYVKDEANPEFPLMRLDLLLLFTAY